jgi:hypothetical protein
MDEIEWNLERLAEGIWSGFSWLRIGTSSGLVTSGLRPYVADLD